MFATWKSDLILFTILVKKPVIEVSSLRLYGNKIIIMDL